MLTAPPLLLQIFEVNRATNEKVRRETIEAMWII
jgi:hypothetical protein